MSLPAHRYCLGHGFSFRRESFGGVLYHYEGTAPDPRVTFVESPFLIDLLQQVADHPETPLDEVVSAISRHFALDETQVGQIERFLTNLIERGALVSAAPE